MTDRRFVLWCAVNLRPANIRHGVGFEILAGILSPAYVAQAMSNITFDLILTSVYTELVGYVMEEIRLHRQSSLDLGYGGPFIGAQLDLTTVANVEYITFSVSYVPLNTAEITRVGLATRAFSGTHTAEDIARWVEEVLVKVTAEKDLGNATLQAEHICMLLDPRRKMRSTDECVNAGRKLRALAEADVSDVAEEFVDPEATETTPTASPLSAPASGESAGVSAEPQRKKSRPPFMLECSFNASWRRTWRRKWKRTMTTSRFFSTGGEGAPPPCPPTWARSSPRRQCRTSGSLPVSTMGSCPPAARRSATFLRSPC